VPNRQTGDVANMSTPLTETVVPPAVGPLAGMTDVIVGRAA